MPSLLIYILKQQPVENLNAGTFKIPPHMSHSNENFIKLAF